MGVAIVRPRNPDGSFGEPEKIGNGFTEEEKLQAALERNKYLEDQVTQTNVDLMALMEIILSGGN